eukprot:11450134-Alexandrium_andersonii.AAC.1
MGPELTQRAVAEVLTPDRANSASALQPALLRLKEQLRDIELPGRPLDDSQRAIALRGLLPSPCSTASTTSRTPSTHLSSSS